MKHQHTSSPASEAKRLATANVDGTSLRLQFARPVQMQLFARVLCDPPLGQPKVIPRGQVTVNFNIVIESSQSFPEQAWEAVLWHNGHDEGTWAGTPLESRSAQSDYVRVITILLLFFIDLTAKQLAVGTNNQPRVNRYHFSCRLMRPVDEEPIEFTVKFRTSASDTWKWVHDDASFNHGKLLFQAAKRLGKFSDFLKDPTSGLTVKDTESEVPDTRLWHLTAQVGDGYSANSGYSSLHLGTPINLVRWFSLVRIWSPWLAPRHGKGKYALTEDAFLSSFLRDDGLHMVILPVSGIDHILSWLRSDDKGEIILHAKNDQPPFSPSWSLAHVLVAVGKTFEAAIAAVIYKARRMVEDKPSMSKKATEIKGPIEQDIEPEWMENWYDGLTFCTGKALGQNLTQQKIINALDELKANDVSITNLIIDENWQSLDKAGESQFKCGTTEFEANKDGFPNGLKFAVTKIRDNHPNIQHVAVWHALLGYWGGISPTGTIAKDYKTKEVRKQDGVAGGVMTIVDADDASRFYNDFYKFLLSSGVDSVKTDAQMFLDLLEDPEDRRRFTTAYQDAWTIASLRYFSEKAISSMSLVPQIIFHTQLDYSKPRQILRNSDDFFPDVPASHPWHVFANAHNAVLTSMLNVVPDWDMFQTLHTYASFHAAARCVSGGPISITDKPGNHDLNLLKQITARTTKGKTVILRPDCIGKTMNVYTGYEDERLLKVGTFVGGQGGMSILGCFNVSERQLCELVHLNDFRGIEPDEEYMIRSFVTGELSSAMTLDSQFPMISLEVGFKGWDILTAYPLQKFTLRGSQNYKDLTKLAVLGLMGKMTGAAAVVRSSMLVEETGRLRVKASLKALGILGIYISTLPALSIDEHFLITMHNQAIPIHTVAISATSSSVLEIDIEKAWNEMGLDSGWSNEVNVDIYIK